MGEIYKITNIVTNKIYVGKTTIGYLNRFRSHIKESVNGRTRLSNSIRKHGIENFKVERICVCPDNLLNKLEIQFIKQYKSYEFGYNITKGGEGGDTLSNHPELHRIKNKMSNISKGRVVWKEEYLTEEFRKKMSNITRGEANPFFGKQHTEEAKKIMRLKKKGYVPWNKGIKQKDYKKENK